jgi:nuclear transport factor 2 (NTF2) superfamily protein
MNTLLSLAYLLVAVIAYVTYVYFRRRNAFLRKLQGPESTSFLLGEYLDLSPLVLIPLCRTTGNEGDLRYQNEVGDTEFEWMRKYGTAWRRSGPLGVRFL